MWIGHMKRKLLKMYKKHSRCLLEGARGTRAGFLLPPLGQKICRIVKFSDQRAQPLPPPNLWLMALKLINTCWLQNMFEGHGLLGLRRFYLIFKSQSWRFCGNMFLEENIHFAINNCTAVLSWKLRWLHRLVLLDVFHKESNRRDRRCRKLLSAVGGGGWRSCFSVLEEAS